MSRWFRHYAGMMRDDKLVRVALRSKQPVERVCWVWGAILESAAEIDDEGRYDFDALEAAYFLRADEADILAIEAALEAMGRLGSGRVVKWGDRQFQSDRSAERQRRYRERKAQPDAGREGAQERGRQHDAEVTSLSRHGDAPETETELETDNPPEPPRKRRGATGRTSFPDDWVLPPIDSLTPQARACVGQWPRGAYETVGEAFACYWRRTGKQNKDWRLTLCEWAIREHGKVMRDAKFGHTPPLASGKPAAPLTAEEAEKLAAFHAMRGDHDKADKLRREATGPPRSIGQLADGIVAGVGNGQA